MNKLYGDFIAGRGAIGLLLLRLMAGSALMLHGLPKMQHAFTWMGPGAPVPGIFQFLSAFSESGGGLALLIGLLTPIAAFGVICNMIVAIVMVHWAHHDPYVNSHGPSWELAASYLAIGCMLLLTGPGTLSPDAFLFGRRPQARLVGLSQQGSGGSNVGAA